MVEYTMATAQEYAARGADLLDRYRPGWAEEIVPEGLDLADPCDCILGQIYGQYDEGCTELSEDDGFYGSSAEAYGFTTPLGWPGHPHWGLLETAWLNEIAIRVMAPLA